MSDSNEGSSSSQTGDALKGAQAETPVNDTPTQSATPQSVPEAPQTDHHVQPNAQPQITEKGQGENRAELLARARTFLFSPQVQNQDIAAKRAFLFEKGLNGHEVDKLLSEMPSQMPTIPPKTYPQGRPSNLPILLLGLARLFTWLAGGSAALIFIYYRFLLPRITQTSLARHSLKSHQLSLLRQLTTSISTLKESQAESFSVLPHPDPSHEPKQYLSCNSVSDVLKLHGGSVEKPEYSKVPEYTLLRCAIKDLSKEKDGRLTHPTTEELFRHLEGQIPWLLSEEGFEYENKLWDILSTSPLFGKIIPSSSSNTQESAEASAVSKTHWEYVPPTPSSDPPLVKALDALSSELPRDVKSRKSPFQHTLQTLSDFTGYITTQVYLPYRHTINLGGASTPSGLSSVEEDLRKEIRALKGLVLNRRSFMPSLPRSVSSHSNT